MSFEMKFPPSETLQSESNSAATKPDKAIAVSGSRPLPVIEDDDDLVPLLRQATDEELAPLVEYILKKGGVSAQLQHTRNYKANSQKGNHSAYADDIAAEIQKFGGNTIWSHAFRHGRGKKYREVLKDVAKRCGVKVGWRDSTAAIEDRVLSELLGKAYERMSEAEQRELLKTLKIHKVPGAGKLAGAAGLQAAIQATGFLPYKAAVIVANGAANAVLGHGLALATNAGLVKGIAVFAGPPGWAFNALLGGTIIAGPAYRVTIPCVIQVALIRKSALKRKRAKFRRIVLALFLAALGTVLAVVFGRSLGMWFSTFW